MQIAAHRDPDASFQSLRVRTDLKVPDGELALDQQRYACCNADLNPGRIYGLSVLDDGIIPDRKVRPSGDSGKKSRAVLIVAIVVAGVNIAPSFRLIRSLKARHREAFNVRIRVHGVTDKETSSLVDVAFVRLESQHSGAVGRIVLDQKLVRRDERALHGHRCGIQLESARCKGDAGRYRQAADTIGNIGIAPDFNRDGFR